MKYIAIKVLKDGISQSGILGFPKIINHDDFADMVKECGFEHYDNLEIIGAGFISRNMHLEGFYWNCYGRSETLNIASNLSDSSLIDDKADDYSIMEITGTVDGAISALSFDGHISGEESTFKIIIPNFLNPVQIWENNLKYVKMGDHRNWSRSFNEWKIKEES